MMQEYKKCFKCNWVKPVEDFYRHPQMADGRVNKCKECNKKDVRQNRLDNFEHYREYDKARANNPDRVIARQEYARTEAGIAAANRAKNKWTQTNPIKRQASLKVNNAVRDGRLRKPDYCESCGEAKRLCGHHDDYAKPLDVRWLCDLCHRAWHKENGAGLNGDIAA
jgi:transposase-like protein